MKTYKPRKRLIIRDITIVGVLVYISTFVSVGVSWNIFLTTTVLVLTPLSALYLIMMGVLPYIRIDREVIRYRTDYGVSRAIEINKIRKITKGSGLGGIEHVLFIYHGASATDEKRNRIKSSYFDRKDIQELLQQIRGQANFEMNEELENYLAGKKRPYSWR